MRIALLDDYQNVARSLAPWDERLPDAEVQAFTDHIGDIEVLAEHLAGFDVVVAMRERTSFPQTLLTLLPELRLLVTTGMRNAAIDIAAANELGITVCGTGSQGNGTAELTWGIILSLARDLCVENAALRAGGWQSTIGMDMAGATLGVVGLGRIGSQVAAVGRAFSMDVVAWSPHLTAERAGSAGARLVAKEALFATADVVTVHLVLSDTTRHVVGPAELAAMKPGALFVNTARAGLVDTTALADIVQEGRLGGVGVDVYDHEPLDGRSPLGGAPLHGPTRTLLTPHLGYVTAATYRRFFGDALDDIVAFAEGHPIRVLAPDDGAPADRG